MNTVQNYAGNDGSANSDYQTVKSGLTPPPVSGNRVTQNSHVPFEPGFISVLVGLTIEGRNADSYGASQVDVLISALDAYKEQVKDRHTLPDNETTLGLIDELKESIMDAMYTRLSDSASILHTHKYQLLDPGKRASK